MEELGRLSLAAWPLLLPREGWAMSPHQGKQMSVNSQKAAPCSWGGADARGWEHCSCVRMRSSSASPGAPLACSPPSKGLGQDRIPQLMRAWEQAPQQPWPYGKGSCPSRWKNQKLAMNEKWTFSEAASGLEGFQQITCCMFTKEETL